MRKITYIVVIALVALMLSSIGYAYGNGPEGAQGKRAQRSECLSGACDVAKSCPTPENCPLGGPAGQAGQRKAVSGEACSSGSCDQSGKGKSKGGRGMRVQNPEGCPSGMACNMN